MTRRITPLFVVLMVTTILLLTVSQVVVAYRVRSNPHLLVEMDIETIGEYIDKFQLDKHRYPQTDKEVCQALSEGLPKLQMGKEQREGVHLMIPLLKDPWGQAYRYVSPGLHNKNSFDVFSLGQDGRYGTGDDINNWDKGRPWREFYRPGRLERIFWFLDERSPLFWVTFLFGFLLSLFLERLAQRRNRQKDLK